MNLPIHVKHAKGLDALLTKSLLLGIVDVTKTNVDELLDIQQHVVLDPAKVLLLVARGQTRGKRNGHAVDVAAVAPLGRVDVGVRVDPDEGNLAVQTLASSLGAARDGANSNAVVTTKGENQAALLGVLVHLLRDPAVDGRDDAGVLHAAVVGVRGGHELVVLLDFGVAVELVA